MNTKRALCVGINEYKRSPLGGCVNDARKWARTLADLGFSSDVLTDGDATRQGILDALQRLIQGAEPGDVLIFQYAGHGTQVRDLDGDELDDGKDESLCPIDIDQGAFLIDDDLWDVFGDLAAGVSLTVFLDCCHSGTSTRTFGSFQPTAPPATDAKRRFLPPSNDQDTAHAKYRKKLGASRGLRPVEAMRWVNFSACQPFEVAWEHGGQGDFTRHATSVLGSGGASLTNEGFQQMVVSKFGSSRAQTPFLDCNAGARDQRLFVVGPGRAVEAPEPPAAGGDTVRDDVADVLESMARLLRSR